jgi:hypothetical protein
MEFNPQKKVKLFAYFIFVFKQPFTPIIDALTPYFYSIYEYFFHPYLFGPFEYYGAGLVYVLLGEHKPYMKYCLYFAMCLKFITLLFYTALLDIYPHL